MLKIKNVNICKKINSIIFFAIYLVFSYKYEPFCFRCINKLSNECSICNNIIFKKIKIFDENRTLNEIIYKNKSISRFGDGEFLFIFGSSLKFQSFNKKLAQKLLKVLNSKEKNLLIGINLPYKLSVLNKLNNFAKNYYRNFFKKNRFMLAKLLKNDEYYSSTITRFYIDLKSKKGVFEYIKNLKLIWDKKDIVIIEGEKTRLGMGNNLLDNARKIQRIICPAIDAFNYYEKIINTIKIKVNKNKLILIALGPTATILTYDLYRIGYRVIDIGHIDIEYEWFLRKAKFKIPINNKYVSESDQQNFTFFKDNNYHRQIISRILN